ncbi:hypothetical protein PRIPAC_97545 [Pristionchus pacificus]|uniref:SET domain-containing protein n=1 Tax=Pristionchus pacificus TaxID=54126 RepID=A0A2A6CH48_PRIPA|nr:hypothetical protein PRIPAC_97545 [Pristionchus pacificus]|eukprot:PDM77459.1 SET domain-containing protein [Pristionchus pacificus]
MLSGTSSHSTSLSSLSIMTTVTTRSRARSLHTEAGNAQGGAVAAVPVNDRASRARARANAPVAGNGRDVRRSSRSVGSPKRPLRQAVVTRQNEGGYLALHSSGRPESAAASTAVVVAPAGGPAANLRSASRGAAIRLPATAAGGSNAPANVTHRITRVQARTAAVPPSTSTAAPAAVRTVPSSAAARVESDDATNAMRRFTRSQLAGARSETAASPTAVRNVPAADADAQRGSAYATIADRRVTRAQTAAVAAAAPIAPAPALGGLADAAIADRRTTRSQAAAIIATAAGAPGRSTPDENDNRRITRAAHAASQMPPQTASDRRTVRVPAVPRAVSTNASAARSTRRRPAASPVGRVAPTNQPVAKRARIVAAPQTGCSNAPVRKVVFASNNEGKRYAAHCNNIAGKFRALLVKAAKTLYVVMSNPKFFKLLGSILDEGDLTSELTTTQVQALTFLEWGGWICFRCDKNIPELRDETRPCHCPSDIASEFSWDGLANAEDYIKRASTATSFVKDRLDFLANKLKEEYGSKKFEQAFPNYGKKRTREFEIKLKRAQREYFEYGFATKTAPIILADWTLGDGEKLLHPGRLGDDLTFSRKAERKLDQMIQKGNRKLNAKLKDLKCGESDSAHKCENPADYLSSKDHYVAGQYKNGRLHYCTRIGVSIALMGNVRNRVVENSAADPMPLLPLEWSRTLVAAACSDAVGCKCDSSCEQRTVTERGCQFMTALIVLPGKGRAIFALEDIPRGAFLAKMGGEVLLQKRETRGRERHMLLGLPEFDEDLVLSPDEVYNAFIFENHSCAPNVVQTLELDGRRDPRWARFAIHSRADITKGSELLWDYYVCEYLETMKKDDENRNDEADHFNFVCQCGSSYCRYSKKKWDEFNEKKAKKGVNGTKK